MMQTFGTDWIRALVLIHFFEGHHLYSYSSRSLLVWRSLWTFIKRRRDYYRIHRFLPERNATTESLSEDGVIVWSDYFSAPQIDHIVQAIEKKDISACPYIEGKDNPSFLWRNYNISQDIPDTNFFFDDEKINSVVKSYLGPNIRCSRKAIAYKNVYNRHKDGPTEYYHFDDWQHRFKVMVYLDDVDESNSPFCYMKRSHRANIWKFWQDFKFYFSFDRSQPKGGGNEDWTCTWLDHQLHYLKKRYSWKEEKVTGHKGTVILFDSRGLHRGSPLVKGCRRVLIQHFRVTDQDGEQNIHSGPVMPY